MRALIAPTVAVLAIAAVSCGSPSETDFSVPVDVGFSTDGGSIAEHHTSVGKGSVTSFRVVAMPDTQFYSAKYPAIFDAQTNWIAQQSNAGTLAFVLHEGDIVDNDVDLQWSPAASSMHRLDDVVPYVLSAGNHDYLGSGWSASRITLIDTYFPVSTFSTHSWFRGTFEPSHIENNYELFDVPGGGHWLILSLEFGPRDVVLAWADAIAKKYANTPAIVVTHAYLYEDDTRYDHTSPRVQKWNPHSYPIDMAPGDVNDGEEIWQKLILGNSNIQFVFCGHVVDRGVGRLLSVRPDGTTVVQVLANYQMLAQGGGGYLRVMEFSPASRWVHVQTYSPYLGSYKTDPDNDFFVEY
jgi:hypothetical protein